MTSYTSPVSSQTHLETRQPFGLGADAQAGVITGILLAALAVIALGVYLWIRRRRRRRQHGLSPTDPLHDDSKNGAELHLLDPNKPNGASPGELDAPERRQELDVAERRRELDGHGNAVHEAHSNSVRRPASELPG